MVNPESNTLFLRPVEEQVLHYILGKILSNSTKLSSGNHFTDSLRIEMNADEHKALLMVYAQL